VSAILDTLPIAPWVLFTVFAATMQSVRTAGQKSLSESITPMSATLVRYIFGLPFIVLYLVSLTGPTLVDKLVDALNQVEFVVPAVLAGIAQIIATVLLILSFRFRNFMVGTSFAKTESLQTALLGTFFFAAPLTSGGWVAVVLGVIGVWLLAMPNRNEPWNLWAISAGLGAGAFFGLTSLWIRQAALSLNHDVILSAAITLLLIVAFQALICVLYTTVVEPIEFKKIKSHWPLALFVGLTSALGSIGWFTAMTWQNPALVKSLGQVEMLVSAVLTLRLFREKIALTEWIGVTAIIASVVILLRVTHLG